MKKKRVLISVRIDESVSEYLRSSAEKHNRNLGAEIEEIVKELRAIKESQK